MKDSILNSSYVRHNNQKCIMDMMRQRERVTRSEVSNYLNFSAPSVGTNILRLINMELIKECEYSYPHVDGPGRKGVHLELNSDRAYVLAAELKDKVICFSISNLREELIFQREYNFGKINNAEEFYLFFCEKISNVFSALALNLSNLKAIVIMSQNIDDITYDFAFVEKLTVRFQAYVVIKDSIKFRSIGEIKYGMGKKHKNFLLIHLNDSLTAGAVINGKTINSGERFCGNIGNMLTSVEQITCGGGNLYSVISSKAICDRVKLRLRLSDMDIDKLQQLYFSKNVVAVQEVDYAIQILAMCIANINAIISIPTVVLNGDFCIFDSIFCFKLESMLKNAGFHISIIKSELSEDNLLKGAFEFGVDTIITSLIFEN